MRMGSASLQNWLGPRSLALDEIEAAHRSIGGSARGRRYATRQINHAYAVLLCSQFQGFCRDLHSECANALLGHALATPLKIVLLPALTQGRKLDAGNPNAGNIGADFGRFGLIFWDDVQAAYSHGETWQDKLEQLNRWRNAIAHQDFDPRKLQASVLRLSVVRACRRACDGLARAFDRVMKAQLRSLTGDEPW